MRIIPKNTKFHYTFRNKLQNQKVVKADLQALYVFGKRKAKLNRIYKINAWLQKHHTKPNPSIVGGGRGGCGGYPPQELARCDDVKFSTNLCVNNTGVVGQVPTTPVGTKRDRSVFVSHVFTQRLLFGNHGIVCDTHGALPVKYLRTARLDIAKALKKKSKVWHRLCCDTPVTARPVETRMGKGKGGISYWEAKVTPGMVLFEFSGLGKAGVQNILKNLQQKSPLRLRHISI